MSDQYVWLTWSVLFLVPWGIVFALFPYFRSKMWKASIFTAPFGLTEPLFVPEYWNPPTLFDLAQRTGFDIESIIFCFGIGGIGVVLYDLLTRQRSVDFAQPKRSSSRHKYHRLILFSPFVVFAALSFFPWNPIYPGIIAMLSGGISTIWCRPDLLKKTFLGGAIFVVYYFILLLGLELLSPGYVTRYWNLKNLTGISLWRFPVEEFLFAIGFGMYWSSVYEHIYWKRVTKESSNETG
ncbi:MAG: lycopene cyclase domain-containing protein [Nitrosomonas ureae]